MGTVDGDSDYQFNRVEFAGRLSDGRIVVVDNGHQIRWYDASGRYRSNVGRRGRGPGEFIAIDTALLTPTDTLIVYDSRNRRATWLSPEERYVRAVTLREIPSGPLKLLGLTPDHRLAASVSTYVHEGIQPNTTYMRKALYVLLASPAGLDTIAQLPGGEAGVWVRFSGGSLTAIADQGLPFAHHVLEAAGPEYFALAEGVADEIRFHDWTGAMTRLSRRPETAGIPVTDADHARYVEDRMAAARRAGGKSLPDVEETIRDMIAALPDGHTMPSFDHLVADARGRVWLRDFVPFRSDDLWSAWTVVGSDGFVERRVITPPGLEVMHVTSEHVTGVERDTLGVEYVVVYRLERRNQPP